MPCPFLDQNGFGTGPKCFDLVHSSPTWTFPNLIFLLGPKFGKSPKFFGEPIELDW